MDGRNGTDRTDRTEGTEGTDGMDHESPPVTQQVGLALRADRRLRGQSQRAYAAARQLSRDTLVRAEVDAGGLKLATVVDLLQGTGFLLAVLPVASAAPTPWWDPTDVAARTRAGRRFPAHRVVQHSQGGPMWWWYHEVLGTAGLGETPRWSAEGFTPPPGTQFGRSPTRDHDGGARWPFRPPDDPEAEATSAG